MSKLPELIAAGPKYESGKKLTIVKKGNLGWLTKEEADEILRRCNCHDDLLAACEEAYKEGYVDGYADGIEADESCVPETTIFQNDFLKAWDRSDAKTTIAKVKSEK